MSAPAFVDTNVLVYADDAADPAKGERARNLIRELALDGRLCLSLQVLQEYFAVMTRKLRRDVPAARRRIELYAGLEIVRMDAGELLAAIDIHERYGLPIWDALIIRAALISGCETLYSEDFQHGFRIGGLEVVNPFKAS